MAFLPALALLALNPGNVSSPSQLATPTLGALITHSCRFRPGTYSLSPVPGHAAMTVKGDNITLDFAGVTLRGTPTSTAPDLRKGLALAVQGTHVTIKNLTARGYKIALFAQGASQLVLKDCDFSYNWKQHLNSTPDAEDASDWMSYHHNENGEWLRYGAGAYLDRCTAFQVDDLRVTGGQCGLMLNRCDSGLVTGCDLSFNSGLGLGMYRSSRNAVTHNRIDWDVRGFSYGVYNRGQDSAGILVFEQCNQNLFAFNSVTHGGDGFFLWAGQTTMDSGKGGCNQNLLVGNDFSYAPTNGIEATFSTNAFINNRVHGCFHGLGGGYSYDSLIRSNDFADNQRAIAIEHGQRNQIDLNRFERDDVAIALWADPIPKADPPWGYPAHHETASTGYSITENSFIDVPLALDIKDTLDSKAADNTLDRVSQPVRQSRNDPPMQLTSHQTSAALPDRWYPMRPTAGMTAQRIVALSKVGHAPKGETDFLSNNDQQGWKYILVDQWGPYDFKRPLIVPERVAASSVPAPGGTSAGSGKTAKVAGNPAQANQKRYEILGPPGTWSLVSARGLHLSATHGKVPGFVTVRSEPGTGVQALALQYVGAATTDELGNVTPAGVPVRFGLSEFRSNLSWNVKFYPWHTSENPADPHSPPADVARIFTQPPLKELKTDKLNFAGYSFAPGVPADHFLTLAETDLDLPTANYKLAFTSDDGIRVWLDGKPLINDGWHYEGPTAYVRTLRLSGKHHLRVEHFQIDGYAELKFQLSLSNR